MITTPFGFDKQSLKTALPKGGRSTLSNQKAESAALSPSKDLPSGKVVPSAKAESGGSIGASLPPPATGDFRSRLQNRLDAPIEDGRDVPEHEEAPDAPTDLGPQAPNVKMTVAKPTEFFIAKESGSHRLVWQNFLHKMKDQLGVSAKDILAAFKSLSEEELKRPPEENISKLVASLGLNDQQSIMAHQFFKELIAKTDTKVMADQLSSPSQAALATMSQKEVRSQAAEQALKNMNNQFFMKAAQPKGPAVPQAPTEAPRTDQRSEGASWLSATSAPAMVPLKAATPAATMAPAALNAGALAIPPELSSPMEAETLQAPVVAPAMKMTAALPKANLKNAWAQSVETPTLPQANGNIVQSMLPKFTAKTSAASVPGLEAETPMPSNIPTTLAPNMPIPILPKPIFAGTPERGRDDGDDQGSDVTFEGDDTVGNVPFSLGNHVGSAETSGAVKTLDATNVPVLPVQDLVQHAHVMIKDGGGEMKVILSPEGLGEVALKVSVQDGKVNVQMITQTDDAKKILESSFHSLRDGLNAQHLNLETIKVDTAQDIGKQMQQQYQDAQRQSARQFLEQFHQGNQGWRQSYFDIPGAELYRSQARTRPEGPALVNGQSVGSRRLDLVA